MDMPPAYPATEVCISAAASHYNAHPDLIRAVLMTEGGRVGLVKRNTNGTVDIGPMQINSVHLKTLEPFSITQNRLANDLCLNIYIGTWLLQRSIILTGDFWKGVGNYHSRTPQLNQTYQRRVWNNYMVLQKRRQGA